MPLPAVLGLGALGGKIAAATGLSAGASALVTGIGGLVSWLAVAIGAVLVKVVTVGVVLVLAGWAALEVGLAEVAVEAVAYNLGRLVGWLGGQIWTLAGSPSVTTIVSSSAFENAKNWIAVLRIDDSFILVLQVTFLVLVARGLVFVFRLVARR